MTVSIVTDSAATLPADLARSLGISIVPERLTLGDRSFRDGEVTLEALVGSIEAGVEVRTAGPAVADFAAVLAERGATDGTLVLTLAHDLGASTFEAARAAAFAAPGPVEVVDTGTAGGGQGLVVLAAAEEAARGASLDRVAATARWVSARVRVVASLQRLDYLARGGHVPGLVAALGRVAGLRPLIDLGQGRVKPLVPARSEASARRRMVAELRSTRPESGSLHLAVLHALNPEAAARLLDDVQAEVEPATLFTAPFSTVMVVHSGPGLLGLAWWWEAPQEAN